MKAGRAWVAAAVALLAWPAWAGEPGVKKTLAECLAIALAQHPSLHAAASTVEAGRQRVWQATSTYLPQVTANFDASRAAISGGTDSSHNGGTHTFSQYSTGVGFTQMLFDFGQALDGIRAAQATEASLRAQATTQRETVILNVKQAYLNLLAAARLLVVADETIRQNQQHLDLAQGRFDVGLAAKFDVTQAQVQLANAELNQVTVRNAVSVARETLRNALGLSTPMDFDIVDDLDLQRVAVDETTALAAAYDKRPELQSLRAQELATSAQIAALQKEHLPKVSGNGSYSWAGNDYPLEENWNIGAMVNLSLFNGGLTTAQIGEAKANLANLKFTEEGTRQNIALEVRQAVLNLHQADESIRVAEKALLQARENLELAEGRYQTGVGNIIELTDSQASLTSAEANQVRTLYSYRTAIAAVEKATAQSFAAE